MKIDAQLTFDTVRFDQDKTAHLVLSLVAPSVDIAEKRQKICIIPCIDVSPSMQGEKIQYAKQSVYKLIDHLKDGDYCGLIQFSSRAEVVAKPQKITPSVKEALKRNVGDLRIGNATNIADALLTGLQLANHMDLPSEIITRVILFTDGQANTGVATRAPDILKLVEPNLGLASVSAFGYGTDADQQLLADLATRGKANYAFVRNPDDALTAFGKELGGLLSTYATDIAIDVTPLAGHSITKVISDVTAEEDAINGELTLKVPDILGEETRHLVLAVKLAAQKNSFPRPVNIFDVKVQYDILGPNARKERKEVDAKVKVQFVKPGEEQDKPDRVRDQIVGLAQVIRTQIEAEEFAKKGDYQLAAKLMADIAQDVGTRGHGAVQKLAANIGGYVRSQSLYSNNSAYLTSVNKGGTRGVGVASYDASALSDLQDLGASVFSDSNSQQTTTSNSFSGDVSPPVVQPSGVLNGQGPNLALFWGLNDPSLVGNNLNLIGNSIAGNSISLPDPPADPPKPAGTPSMKVAKKKAQKKSSRW